jgi:hypothetical protein
MLNHALMKAINKKVIPMAKAVSLSSADLAPQKPVSQSATEQRGNEEEPKEELIPLQFKMPRSWVREFKLTAADKELKLNELLKECFSEYIKTLNK